MSDRIKVEDKLDDMALTVKGLMAILRDENPDAHVVFASDYGDILHTKQALCVTRVGNSSSEGLEETAYSLSGIALTDDWDDYQEVDDDRLDVVVLS